MATQPSKQELLDAIKESRAKLEDLLSGLSEDQMTQAGAQDNWSIKDLLAHIIAWERLAMDRIHAATTGEALQFPVIKTDDFVDTFNAEAFEANKDRALDDVLADFHATHQAFYAQIETLDENLLPQTLPFDWAGDLTFQVLISANTYWHYPEHAEAIENWLGQQAQN
jgi:hypothetical protein